MKARVNPQKCEAYGDCHAICPEVFALDEWGYAYVVNERQPVPAHLEKKVREAAQACPTGAVVLEE